MTNTYTVELCRKSYITMTVEAESVKDAEQKAWDKLDAEYADQLDDEVDWKILDIRDLA